MMFDLLTPRIHMTHLIAQIFGKLPNSLHDLRTALHKKRQNMLDLDGIFSWLRVTTLLVSRVWNYVQLLIELRAMTPFFLQFI